MSNVEQEEAKKVVDELAREIHGIYGQHAAEAGLRTPKWEELPEAAKGISRDMAKFTLSKMMEIHVKSAEKKVELQAPPIALPKSWTPKEALEFVDGIQPKVDAFIEKISDEKRMSPLAKGIDEALAKMTERITLGLVADDQEILARLQAIVQRELALLLSDGDKEA